MNLKKTLNLKKKFTSRKESRQKINQGQKFEFEK